MEVNYLRRENKKMGGKLVRKKVEREEEGKICKRIILGYTNVKEGENKHGEHGKHGRAGNGKPLC